VFQFRFPGKRGRTQSDPVAAIFGEIKRQVPWCRRDVLERLLELSIEIAREGREGRRIGTVFTLGEADRVLTLSRPLILDPLAGHAPSRTSIFDESACGTIKELAQLDGAFVVRADGAIQSASRYLDTTAEGVDLPLGLGTRHLAAASISKKVGIVAIVVSESAVVRVFCQGQLIAELIPELWLFRHYMQRPHTTSRQGVRRRSRSSG
jgi:DNA integrity scanning protein DisA with diadenylate cyclase activity